MGKKNKVYREKRPFRERVAMFLYGRNGFDNICNFVWIISIILVVVNLFVGSIIISLVESALIIYTVFRSMSKNIYKRRKENEAYLKIKRKITGFFRLRRNKWKDRKTHVYRKCKKCKQTLRLPKVKGKHTVNCPCCHNRFDVKI